jgi:type 1 fimbriae regulatory protein FimB
MQGKPKPLRGRRERSREYLTGPEIKRFLEAAKTATRNPERDYCMMLVTYQHALRVSELIGLKVSDADLEERTINVRRLKGSLSGRHPIFPNEAKALKHWLLARAAIAPDTDSLFVSEQRRDFTRAAINALVQKVAEHANLNGLSVHPHTLRHSCGYALVNKGTDIRTLQAFMGHSRIENTVRYTAVDATRFSKLF